MAANLLVKNQPSIFPLLRNNKECYKVCAALSFLEVDIYLKKEELDLHVWLKLTKKSYKGYKVKATFQMVKMHHKLWEQESEKEGEKKRWKGLRRECLESEGESRSRNWEQRAAVALEQ